MNYLHVIDVHGKVLFMNTYMSSQENMVTGVKHGGTLSRGMAYLIS
jgi:hypothetical protein